MLIVVGGHSRNIGKTSVVCGIIQALAGWNWTAVKITQYGHGECSRDGSECDCSGGDHKVAFSEETLPDTRHDSGRYLAAGARRSYWLRTPVGGLAEAMPQVRRVLASGENVIIESNSVLGLIRPDLCYLVLDPSVTDFKQSTLRFLDRADGLVFSSRSGTGWASVSPLLLKNKPRYYAPPPTYVSADLVGSIKVYATVPDTPCR